MPDGRTVTPNILAITNENPDWPDLDKQYADETWNALLKAFDEQGLKYRSVKFFEDLRALDGYDPREWLVWNGGEEMAGRPWSDAEVADELERRGFAYTGADAAGLRRTQNRDGIKRCLAAAAIPTLPWRVCQNQGDAGGWTSFPAIVKGVGQHASVGIDRDAVVASESALRDRIVFLRDTYGDAALVEPFLDTREFQVAVWGNDAPEALPPSEIVYTAFDDPCDRLHTQAWKIDRASRGFREITMPCPAPLDRPDWRARVEATGVAAYRALGLRDFARFDLRMLGDEPQVLDANANPELDPESVVIAGGRARGLTLGQMARRIVALAAVRMPR
jgi:D-alanine-D-alanine ligase